MSAVPHSSRSCRLEGKIPSLPLPPSGGPRLTGPGLAHSSLPPSSQGLLHPALCLNLPPSVHCDLIARSLTCFSEKAMAPHSSTLAWKIPWMEEPGRRQSMGSQSRTRLSDFTFTFHFHALEKEMATHSSVLAWRIPGKREPGGLPSMGSHRVGHD